MVVVVNQDQGYVIAWSSRDMFMHYADIYGVWCMLVYYIH